VPGGRKRSDVTAPVKVRAKAELGATMKYTVRKKITEQIPEDVTRAKASAWLTILSPITEWAGLKGDQLRHKRELLRIHQEETLTAILRCAAPGLAKLEGPIEPVPAKFLIPFLENASLEDPDSELVNLWAGLLVSSAGNYSGDNVYYVRLLSQMSSIQAQLFEAIIGERGPGSVEATMDNIFAGFRHDFLLDLIVTRFGRAKRSPRTLSSAWSIISRLLNVEGLVIEHIDLGRKGEPDDYASGAPPYSYYDDKRANDFDILTGLGILNYTDTGYFVLGEQWDVKVMSYYVSRLGLKFATACGVGTTNSRRMR
jgi:hypothetical protein